jgi:hypothetical protein
VSLFPVIASEAKQHYERSNAALRGEAGQLG